MPKLMQTLAAGLAAAGLFWSARPAPSATGEAEALAAARQVAADLTGRLRDLLSRELAAGGFAGAVRVCAETAQQTTQEFAARAGHSVRRVSLKYRNVQNAPDAYERKKLEELAQLHARGQLPGEISEVVSEAGQAYLRYLKPITIAAMCLNCHGPRDSLKPEIRQVLDDRYPGDRAIGYHAGDFRGAVSVRIALSPGPR